MRLAHATAAASLIATRLVQTPFTLNPSEGHRLQHRSS
jgi:hypothetical protein